MLCKTSQEYVIMSAGLDYNVKLSSKSSERGGSRAEYFKFSQSASQIYAAKNRERKEKKRKRQTPRNEARARACASVWANV